MIPEDWEYCSLTKLNCQGHEFSVYADRTGKKYGKKGLQIYCDGTLVSKSEVIQNQEIIF